DALAALGIENMMVEIGGEVRVAGRRADGGPWRIGIDAPVAGTIPGEKLASIVELTDIALATSGSYRQFRDVGGKRVTHIVDPRTRESVAHDLVSVSVLAPTCAQADALATGLFVLGKNEGTTLCAKLSGVDCFFITEDGTTAATPGFARRMKHD
ncbi:FAD:protein FMN transferase, partial [bacterium]|nr:FAD:protein FMN transferase [bacterium]